jgi:2-hydroxycyclohexanecarboxyl-CoA dehydrogenase
MDLGLEGKVAIVTGAGKNIGAEIARTLAKEKACVIVNDLYSERADKIAEEIRVAGCQAISKKADVRVKEEVDAIVEETIEEFGHLDILVNNAGILPSELVGPQSLKAFVETDRKDWEAEIEVNLYGTFNCCKAVLRYMITQKSGRIINILSDTCRIGEPWGGAYYAAKGGLIPFSKAIAKQVGRYCIAVNCVMPGVTPDPEDYTKWGQAGLFPMDEKRHEILLNRAPLAKGLQRLGLPSDVAYAVAFLASDRVAPFVTGQVLSVGGGRTMGD